MGGRKGRHQREGDPGGVSQRANEAEGFTQTNGPSGLGGYSLQAPSPMVRDLETLNF